MHQKIEETESKRLNLISNLNKENNETDMVEKMTSEEALTLEIIDSYQQHQLNKLLISSNVQQIVIYFL